MTKYPTVYSIDFDTLADNYGALDIHNALTVYIARERNPLLSGIRLQHAASLIVLPFYSLQIYHKIRFYNAHVDDWLNGEDIADVAHARPSYNDKHGRPIAGRFDTILVRLGQRDMLESNISCA